MVWAWNPSWARTAELDMCPGQGGDGAVLLGLPGHTSLTVSRSQPSGAYPPSLQGFCSMVFTQPPAEPLP